VTSRTFALAVYVLLALLGVGLQLWSRRPGTRVPSFGRLLRETMRTTTGRVSVIAGWAWLGLHFFAR
jgi:Family of unknown function (DUF6186)